VQARLGAPSLSERAAPPRSEGPAAPPAVEARGERAPQVPDPYQKEAVEHGEGPLLVVAGPGTGKTFVIQHRVLHLITKLGVKPEEILCLTFTEKAAEEMRNRIEEALAHAAVAGTPLVATFHSFCQRVLTEFSVAADMPRAFRVLEGPRLLRFIMSRVDSFNLKHFRIKRGAIEFAQELERFASRCHDELMSTDAALERANALEAQAKTAEARQEARLWVELAECKRMLEEELDDSRFVTFGEIITRVIGMLKAHPEVLAKLQARHKHLLIDEFQDDNYAQGWLVSALAEPEGRVTVVGDDDQSIYRFRGAHPLIIREFEELWGARGLKKVILKQSYRSTPPIISASSLLISKSPAHDAGKVLAPAEGKQGPPVRVVRSPDGDRQAAYVADRVRRAQADGTPLREIAVLFRSMNHADPIVRALQGAAIPAEVLGAGGLFDRREVRDALAWSSFVTNPLRDDLAAFRVLWAPEVGLDPLDVARVTRAASEARKPVFELVKDPGRVADLSVEAKAKLSALATRVGEFQGEARQFPAGEALARVLEFSQIRARLDPDTPSGRRQAKNLHLLLMLAESVGADTDHPGLEEFVELCALIAKSALDLPEAEPDLTEESVKLMTIHQAKGKEFGLVLVPDLIERRFPPAVQADMTEEFFVGVHHPETKTDVRFDEERRLLYVAMTRAKDALELLTFEAHGGGRSVYASPFLEELGYTDGAPKGRLASGLEVREFAPLTAPAREGPSIPYEADADELVRGAIGILRGGAPPDDAAALEQLRGLVARWAASQRTGGSTPKAAHDLLKRLEPLLGTLPVPKSRDRAPVHLVRPGVKEGVLDLSYSQLDTYDRCPRRYLYSSVLNLRGRSGRHAVAGNAIHAALEEFYKRFKHARDAKLDDLLALFDEEFRKAEFDNELERRQHYDDGVEMAKAFFEAEKGRTTQPVELEKSFEFMLGDTRIRGRIDRIDKHPDGRFEVIDYKSGRIDSKKSYANENLQLPIYAMAMDELKMKLKCATIYGLKEGKRVTLNRGEDLTEEAIARARARILEIAKAVRAGRFEPLPSPQNCDWCDFRMLCPAVEAK
jgi:DNA helicase-2/ATP-dependent DNA helicase PcrA